MAQGDEWLRIAKARAAFFPSWFISTHVFLMRATGSGRGWHGTGGRALVACAILFEIVSALYINLFVGVLPWEAALWAIDQCVVHRRGWALLSDVAVACLWLLRRPLRRIAKAKRGLDELRDLLRDGLRDAPLHELQALLAGLDARVAPAPSAAGAAPVMRVAVPLAAR